MPKPRPSAEDLFAEPPSGKTRIRVGCGGWTFVPWRDNFYPAKLAQRRELEYASRHVTAIEVNGTYYGAQKPATYAKWRSETPEGFVFSLKAPRFTTDRKVLADAGKSIDAFVEGGLAELGDRLGPINWQFPPHKAFDAADFEAFLALLPHQLNGHPLRHVAEVRHASFVCAQYVELARRYHVATVFADSPKYPSFADITGDFVYARLMCSEAAVATGYRPKVLDSWAARAAAWSNGDAPDDLPYAQSKPAPRQPRDVFVYFINGAKERAPHAAMALIERLDPSA